MSVSNFGCMLWNWRALQDSNLWPSV